MDVVTVDRLDHLGIIAGVIKDVGIIEMIDAHIVPDDQEAITTGEAVAGMILNGLGFSDRPMSLTPQFFANKPVALLLRDGVSAVQRGRAGSVQAGRDCPTVQQSGHDQFCPHGGVCTGDGHPGHCDHPRLPRNNPTGGD